MATILIAEDMALVRESIAAALRHAGHDVLCASNGVEALGILRGQVPDLLLLDINMPEMSGIDLLKKIRASESLPNPPTVFLTERGVLASTTIFSSPSSRWMTCSCTSRPHSRAMSRKLQAAPIQAPSFSDGRQPTSLPRHRRAPRPSQRSSQTRNPSPARAIGPNHRLMLPRHSSRSSRL